jgi:hypothetical protein
MFDKYPGNSPLHPMYVSQINSIPYGGAYKGGGFLGLGRLFGRKTIDEHGNVHRTGLRKAAHGLHKVEKAIRPIAKTALPIIGAIGGNMFGGPAGALLGGSMGGALSSKKHPLDHALGGAALGLGASYLLPKIGEMFSVDPSGTMGNVMGMGTPKYSLSDMFGWKEGAEEASEQAAEAAMSSLKPGSKKAKQQGMFGDWSSNDLINAALVGTTVLGTLGGRERIPEEQVSMAEMMERNKPKWGPQDQPMKFSPAVRRYVPPPRDYRGGFDPEHVYFEDVVEEPERHAKGGYIEGESSGQADDVNYLLPEDSYVMNATDLSLLGDGNSKHGNYLVEEWEDDVLKKRPVRYTERAPTRTIRAKLSPGERVIKPEVVIALGNGNPKKGAKKIDKMRQNVRKHKGVTKILPPKSKPISKYMK